MCIVLMKINHLHWAQRAQWGISHFIWPLGPEGAPWPNKVGIYFERV